LYLSQSHIFESAPKQAISTVPDVGPGQNKAILTLSNGQSIALDASARGIVAQEGQMKITGSGNGELAYAQQGEGSQTATGNNTISTPAGGQYRVVLPDGSKVWLNAASSLNYPAVFTGPVRSVSVTGECYFEIAKDAGHPFIVQIADKQKITVLGTHFNVSAYTNDDQISITLLEGSVKVSEHSRTAGNSGKEIRLMVGEQATMGKDGVFSKKDVDVNQAVAWKEGLFYFQNADVPTVLRQIERWYNVRVVYNAADYTEMFSGKIHRDANLSQMLEILRFSGLDFKLQSSGDKSLNGELVLTSARD
ncbi:MAG TPA: FecR domain-containing protein, partial [Dyadobacter sp.]|nr:FecR domain-containing protein [Dyadobacter sp.]